MTWSSVLSVRRLSRALMLIALITTGAGAQEPEEWAVTIAVRLTDSDGKEATIHVALPSDDLYQQIDALDVNARGMAADIVKGDHPEVIFRGPISNGKRVSVSYRVRLVRSERTPPPLKPPEDPPLAVVGALSPAPLFPSRSILVREFLEHNVAPQVRANTELIAAIYNALRTHLERRRDGKSLALDVLRSGEGKRIGLERCFTTLLRCAHFPARFVEGIKLDSSTHRKRVFWTEVWSQGEWWPISASGGWKGHYPASYLAVARDGRRVVRLEGEGNVSYHVETTPLTQQLPRRTRRRR